MANPEHVELLLRSTELWNRWREENSNIVPDLYRAVLRGAGLNGANLSGVNLEGADLVEADLSGADLFAAFIGATDLKRANFSFASLIGVEISGSNLEKANFTGANLSSANLSRAIIDETKFSKAVISYTQFSNIDLSTAIGLETVQHGGPSSIGIDTLINSKGKIPEVFLRGCGVPEEFLTYLPSLLAKPIEFYSCFISYAHADKAFARQLHDFLQGRGIRCWLDEHQLKPGHDIRDEIDRGIKLWDKVLLCASESSLNSWWVDKEIERAFKKEETIWKSRNKKVLAIIPLDLDGYIFSGWESSKAIDVKTRLTCDFKGWQTDNDKLQKQFEFVLTALRTDEGRETPPVSRF